MVAVDRHDVRRFALCLAWALIAAGCATTFPARPASPPDDADAISLLRRAASVLGNDPYEAYGDVAVSYRGEWGTLVQAFQPILTDGDFRRVSEERVLLREGLVAQAHRGPGGRKHVLRTADEVYVSYDGVVTTDSDVLETSALVADAYSMFLLGPAWLLRHGSDWTRIDDGTAGGRTYVRLLARLRPGVGLSAEDEVVAWIDPESLLLYRVHFTLEGHRNTRGAHVDVTFSEYRPRHGRLWPTRFVERVRGPVDIHAHEWTLEGIDVDRGLTASDLGRPGSVEWTARAKRPAAPLESGDAGVPGDRPRSPIRLHSHALLRGDPSRVLWAQGYDRTEGWQETNVQNSRAAAMAGVPRQACVGSGGAWGSRTARRAARRRSPW